MHLFSSSVNADRSRAHPHDEEAVTAACGSATGGSDAMPAHAGGWSAAAAREEIAGA